MTEETVVDAQPEVAQVTATPELDATAAPVSDEVAPEPKKSYSQEELDAEAAKIRNRYERKMEKLRVEKEIQDRVQREVQKSQQQQPQALTREQFASDEEYIQAVLDERVNEAISKRDKEQATRAADEQRRKEAESLSERAERLATTGESRYRDFDEVLEQASSVKFSAEMHTAILESDQSADIAYFLGKNLPELERIAKLSPASQAREIGKLELRLAEKPKPKPSNAPEPVTPIGTGSSNTKSLNDMSMSEYMDFRKKQGAKWA